jgi:hypothetical protein
MENVASEPVDRVEFDTKLLENKFDSILVKILQ